MSDTDAIRLMTDARAALDGFDFATSLGLLAKANEIEGRTAAQDVLRCDALIGLERFGDAQQISADLIDHGGDWARPEALLAKARVIRQWSRYIDDALEAALDAAELAEKRGDDMVAQAARARLEAARVFAEKRCRDLANREIARARALVGDTFEVAYHAGSVALAFDERVEAKELYESIDPGDHLGARIFKLGALANLEYIMGEFDAAHAHLDAIEPLPTGALWPMRLRAGVLASQQRWAEAAEKLRLVIAASPGADTAPRAGYERASYLYHAGDLDGAVAALRELLETAPERSHWAHCGHRMLALLEHPEAAHRPKTRLAEFPSVAQLRDHCGPASCELYMRYFGLTADQIEIAREIKSVDGGTPTYKMRRYLEHAGFVSRRVEADLPQIKKLIDAGFPVIMEESYSTSSHVAVAIGYDDALELLEVQDPMTHRIRHTHYEDLADLRNLSNHGALVGAPKDDAAKIAALDAAGAVECEYIALIDEAWKNYDDESFERADELAAKSLELHREYEQTWLYLFHRANQRYRDDESVENRRELHRILGEVTAIWPDDEWPQQLVGRVLYFIEGRYGEARGAFERARDLDPNDAYNWSMLADCHLRWGEDDQAYDALVEALGRSPSYVRANENLAELARKRGQRTYAWQLNDAARELHPDNYYNHAIHGQLLEGDGDDEAALAAFDRALELDPERDWVVNRRAKLLAKMGRVDDAAAAMAALVEKRNDVDTLIDQADLLYNHDRFEEAVAACDRLLALDDGVAAGYSIKGASLGRLGQVDEGLALLDRALEMRPLYSWVHLQKGEILLGADRGVAAIGAFAAALGLSGGNANHEYALGDALARCGYADEAVRHLRAAGVQGNLSEDKLRRIGEALVASRKGDPYEFFEEVARRRPRDLAVLRANARTMLEVLWAPRSGYPVLRQIEALDPGDPYAMASRGQDLMWESLETEAEGEQLLRAALDKEPTLGYGRRALADGLNQLGRHREALEVLEPTGLDFRDAWLKVKAHAGLEDFDGAAAIARGFEDKWGEPERPCVGALKLEYEIAKARADWAKALEIAEAVSRESHERDDDGRLDRWEEERFECMVLLGELERATSFGLSQAMDGESLGRLAFAAHKADAWELTGELAGRALRLAPDDSLALAAMALTLEMRGDIGGAVETWNKLGSVDSGWHIWQEQLARMALGDGNLEVAQRAADDGVSGGHTCAWSFGVRAQVRFVAGDLDGARSDLARARQLASPRDRREHHLDVWALEAALDGKLDEAGSLYDRYLEGKDVSELDRQRLAMLREKLEIPVVED